MDDLVSVCEKRSLQPLFSAWPPPTQPSLQKAESKKEQKVKDAFLSEKADYEMDTIYGSVGKADTNSTHKRNARKKKTNPY
jgi:hypothetical protein